MMYSPDGSDRKSTRLNSSHEWNSYAVFCLKKKKQNKPFKIHEFEKDIIKNNILFLQRKRKAKSEAVVYQLNAFDLSFYEKFFFLLYGDHRYLHSFPTRRSSD